MPLWGNLDGPTGNSKPLYSNNSTTFGVSVTEAVNTANDGPKIAHAGWVKQTVGTGGRAGRVHYETLVATGSITGDDPADDTFFPGT